MRSALTAVGLALTLCGAAFAQGETEDTQPTMEEQALEPLGSGGVGQPEPDPRDVDAFVAANLEWLLTHASAFLLTDAFGYDNPDADAADAFASSRVSARHGDGEAAERLVLVAEALSLADGDTAPNYFAEHDLDRDRAFRVLCVANGADNAVARRALSLVDAPPEGYDACRVDRDLATEEWDVLLSADFAYPDDPPTDVPVTYEEASAEDEAARAFVTASGLLEALAEELGKTYTLFDPIRMEARSCANGEGIAVADGTLSLCYGLVRDLRTLGEG